MWNVELCPFCTPHLYTPVYSEGRTWLAAVAVSARVCLHHVTELSPPEVDFLLLEVSPILLVCAVPVPHLAYSSHAYTRDPRHKSVTYFIC
jgi:hypothetical protein